MAQSINFPEEYIAQIPDERREAFGALRQTVLKNLPPGFKEVISYGMIGFVVPHEIYPQGYHCSPELPLPFVNIANQKNFIALYHMGIYSDPELLTWFEQEYPKHCKTKLDMGKSCIRFNPKKDLPNYALIKLLRKLSLKNYLHLYQQSLK